MAANHANSVLEEVLEDREQIVIKMRFGLDDDRQKTLGEIGKLLGISRERVRQIETEALQKLRVPAVRDKLKSTL